MKKIIILALCLCFSVSLVLFPVSASSVNGNEFLNINDYASYSSSADNTKVNATLKFPADWTTSLVFWDYVGLSFGAPDLVKTGNNINIYNESIDYYFSLIMYPFTEFIPVGSQVGYQVQNSKILDLRYLPSDSYFTYSFDVKLSNPRTSVENFEGTLREDIVYVDKDGKILQHDINYIADPPNYESDGYRVIQWGGVIKTQPVDGAVGFIPFFSLRNIACDWDSDIIIDYKGLDVYFSLSNLEYESMQNGMIQDTLDSVQNSIDDVKNSINDVQNSVNDIENKIDNAVNGEVAPDKSPVDDNVNDMLGKEDELLQSTQQGRENLITYITQAISEIYAYVTAFVAVGALVDGFFFLPIIGPLITVSLALGIFSLIVNLGMDAQRSDKAKQKEKSLKGG